MVLDLFEKEITKNDLIKKMHKEKGLSALEINETVNKLLSENKIKFEDNKIIKVGDNMDLPFKVSEEEIRAEEIRAEKAKVETPKKEVSLKQMTKGGNMNRTYSRQNTGGFRVDPKLKCTPEQKEFAELVNNNKGKLFDLESPLIHKGCEIAFGGAGGKALRYKIALELNLSEKEPVEEIVLYLDWNDNALYIPGGIADQIREILGANSSPKTTLKPVSLAQLAGK